MDPFAGQIQEPLTLHRYFYAGADPINKFDPSGETAASLTFGSGIATAIASISVPVNKAVLGSVVRKLFVAGVVGLTLASSSVNPAELERQRDALRRDAETQARGRRGRPRILFHYSSKANIDSIFTSGTILAGEAAGAFPAGVYATNLAGWLAVQQLSRSQLIKSIFGRDNGRNRARTEWFVAFVELLPKFRFTKLRAPFIFHYPKTARIVPLVKSPTLLEDQ